MSPSPDDRSALNLLREGVEEVADRLAKIELPPPEELRRHWMDCEYFGAMLAKVLAWAAECWPSIPRADQQSFLERISKHEPAFKLVLARIDAKSNESKPGVNGGDDSKDTP